MEVCRSAKFYYSEGIQSTVDSGDSQVTTGYFVTYSVCIPGCAMDPEWVKVVVDELLGVNREVDSVFPQEMSEPWSNHKTGTFPAASQILLPTDNLADVNPMG